jgi:catechol-2,3-dioxygenase
MASPCKISHIVLQTNRPRALREWYCTVLGAEIVHENAFISFISYDDEHHRVAFINPGALEARQPGAREAAISAPAARPVCTTSPLPSRAWRRCSTPMRG